jgi:hypothetical protein
MLKFIRTFSTDFIIVAHALTKPFSTFITETMGSDPGGQEGSAPFPRASPSIMPRIGSPIFQKGV